MYVRNSQGFGEFVLSTRRPMYLAIGYAAAIIAMYRLSDGQWISLPWSLLTMLGLTLAITSGVKAVRTCGRTTDARRVWASIIAASRSWTLLSCNLPLDGQAAGKLVHRHLAWLAALRHQVRFSQEWEASRDRPNLAYGSYAMPEKESALAQALGRYVDATERRCILQADNKAGQVLVLQGKALTALVAQGGLDAASSLEMHRLLQQLQALQASTEQLKEDSHPRQSSLIGAVLLWVFALFLPFGLLDALAPLVIFDDALMGAVASWCIVPLSALVTWLYLALDRAGQGPPNPFESSADGVSLPRICMSLEQELKGVLAEASGRVPQRVGPAVGVHMAAG